MYLDEVSSAGNAAGTGARIALLNRQSRQVIETLVKNIEKIETALEPKFQDYFVDAMAFPNKTDPFPNLFSLVTRPAVKEVADNGWWQKASAALSLILFVGGVLYRLKTLLKN